MSEPLEVKEHPEPAGPDEPGYISGLVFIRESEGSFVVNTDGVDFGAEGNPDNLTPSFTWYIDNKGDGIFDEETPLKGPSTEAEGGKTLSLIDAYLDCNILLKVTASPLKGFVYAERLYTKNPELYISGEAFLTSSGPAFTASASAIDGVGNPVSTLNYT
jgi:hypothetical protein